MAKKKKLEPSLIEFRIHFRISDSVGLSVKYFMALDLEQAFSMFDYVCKKNAVEATITELYHWNRWLSRWEKYEISEFHSLYAAQNYTFNFLTEECSLLAQ
jgi:hypothetical protein